MRLHEKRFKRFLLARLTKYDVRSHEKDQITVRLQVEEIAGLEGSGPKLSRAQISHVNSAPHRLLSLLVKVLSPNVSVLQWLVDV